VRVGKILAFAGLATTFGLFASAISEHEYGDPIALQTKIGIGTAVFTVVVGVWAGLHHLDYNEETQAAYYSYTDDLAARLSLCIRGLQMVPCESLSVVGGPSVQPPTSSSLLDITPNGEWRRVEKGEQLPTGAIQQ
jgi:hypothetical protein